MRIEYLRLPPRASVIFGTDQRTRVQDTTVFPWSAVGQVQAIYANEILEGTGAMIGNHTVLTAAHVVYDPSLGGWADSITFIPGLNGNSMPFGQATVTSHIVPQAWIDTADEGSDIAVLGLNAEVGTQTEFFQIAEPTASFLNGLPLASAGYPADLDNNFQYSAPGTGTGVDGNFLLEDIDTEPGQSGSPIWYVDATSGRPLLIAVLKGTRQLTDSSGNATIQGIGVLVTPQFATLIDDALAANGDAAQDIPTAPIAPVTPSTPQCGTCGAGLGQAGLVCTLGYGACFFSRRRKHL